MNRENSSSVPERNKNLNSIFLIASSELNNQSKRFLFYYFLFLKSREKNSFQYEIFSVFWLDRVAPNHLIIQNVIVKILKVRDYPKAVILLFKIKKWGIFYCLWLGNYLWMTKIINKSARVLISEPFFSKIRTS